MPPLTPALAPRNKMKKTPSSSHLTPIIYPIEVPPERLKRSLELYTDVKREEALEQQAKQVPSALNDFIKVPSDPSASASKKSPTPSMYETATDLSSLISFTEDDEGQPARQPQVLDYKNKPVKINKRNKLTPVKKAKAAFKRHLGACSICHDRKVPCPLDHHDIQRLEQLWIAAQNRQSAQHSASSRSTSSQRTTTSIPLRQQEPLSTRATETLLQVGAGAQLLGQTQSQSPKYDEEMIIDLQSLDDDFDSHNPIAPPVTMYNNTERSDRLAGHTLTLPSNPSHGPVYGAPHELPLSSSSADYNPVPHQQNIMILIGVFRGGFYSCHDPSCTVVARTEDEIQLHFEALHCAFTRVAPAHRFICSMCNAMNGTVFGSCYNCHNVDHIERWVVGNHIIHALTPQHPYDDYSGGNDTASEYLEHSQMDSLDYGSNRGSQYNSSTDNGDSYEYADLNQYDHLNSTYGGFALQGNGYGASHRSHNSGSSFYSSSANYYGTNRLTQGNAAAVHHYQSVFGAISLLALVLLGCIHDWITPSGKLFLLEEHVSLFGFFVIASSFFMCLSIRQQLGRRRIASATSLSTDAISDRRVLRDMYFSQLHYLHVGLSYQRLQYCDVDAQP